MNQPMNRLMNRAGRPSVRPRVRVALAAVAAAAAGIAVRDLGTGLLSAGCVLVLGGVGRRAAEQPAWPPATDELPGQVGHPLVSQLVSDLEAADRDATILRRLDRRVQLGLGRPEPAGPQRIADLHRILTRAEQDGA